MFNSHAVTITLNDPLVARAVVIELAVDPEPVTRMLFSSLAYQLARWFTRNQAREAAETVALLDAITEGLADPMSNDDGVTGSGKTSGATAQRRSWTPSG